jgi:hypothetical protein
VIAISGRMFVWGIGHLEEPRFTKFPTKRHWAQVADSTGNITPEGAQPAVGRLLGLHVADLVEHRCR